MGEVEKSDRKVGGLSECREGRNFWLFGTYLEGVRFGKGTRAEGSSDGRW